MWPSWLPRGVVTIMDGNPGVSKSTLVADIVARLTTGGDWPDGTAVGAPIRAMWITTEDDPGRVLRPRIEAAGGDPAMVLFVKSEVVFPAARTAFLELLVRRRSEPLGLGMVVLDPLFSHIEASVRTIADAEMRRGVMNPLNEAAEAADVAVLVVRHFNKDTTAGPLNRGAGSLGGIVGAARALWTVTVDPEDETGDTKAVGVSKLNYALTPPALRYRVVSRVPPSWVTGTVSGIDWLGAAPVSIAEILMETASSHDAQPVLVGLPADGPKAAEVVYAQMKARGFGRQAVRSAKSRLSVLAHKTSMAGGWEWSLPDDEEAEESEGVEAAPSRPFGDRGPKEPTPLRDPLHASSDSSDSSAPLYDPTSNRWKKPKKLVEGRFTPAPAPAREGEWVTPCRDYSNHQASHRRTKAGWVCDACNQEETA